MRASGTPLVSWIKIRSVMFWARHVWRRSFKTVFPRFKRIELGNTRRSSFQSALLTSKCFEELTFENCSKRDEGERDVVMTILGS
jgi:hypothetical protein